MDGETEGVTEGDLDIEGVIEEEGVIETELLAEGVREDDGEDDGVMEGDAEGVAVMDGVAEELGVTEALAVLEGDTDGVADLEGVLEGEDVVEGVVEGDADLDGETDIEGETEGVGRTPRVKEQNDILDICTEAETGEKLVKAMKSSLDKFTANSFNGIFNSWIVPSKVMYLDVKSVEFPNDAEQSADFCPIVTPIEDPATPLISTTKASKLMALKQELVEANCVTQVEPLEVEVKMN